MTKQDETRSESHDQNVQFSLEMQNKAAGDHVPDDTNVFQLGRYKVIKLLGIGGFGQVMLARDSQLDRFVAIKVPNTEKYKKSRQKQDFLAEAQMSAGLRHDGIVTVYDVGWENSVPYIVMEYIQGRTLAEFIRSESWTADFAARLLCKIAEALHHAHEKGFIHRDLKPHNILLDKDDRPRITDFGLAVRENDLAADAGHVEGTIQYMAPEQASGENHRIDRRTDIWALGVILYEMLCHRRPFEGDCVGDITSKILKAEFRPPAFLDPSIGEELSRICLRCMSRRMSERYRTAKEFAEDLAQWLNLRYETRPPVTASDSSSSDRSGAVVNQSMTMVPRGLRSFRQEDAGFFLRLLPGPYDRDGLPLSLSFWLSAIGDPNVPSNFPVGLLYGPSGCGKSSFVKAGLIPSLGSEIERIYIDATTPQLDHRLMKAITSRFAFAKAPENLTQCLLNLRDQLDASRRSVGQHQKLVVFIDQMEQFLAAEELSPIHPLVQALRQCDGKHIQCVLMVRDDFWLSISRLMALLEVGIVDGENAMLIDSFDLEHGKNVLKELGRSLSCLPMNESEMTQAQVDFINRVVTDLSEDGRLYPVRISIFGELVRKLPWNLETLEKLGGVDGIAVSYLEHSVGQLATAARQVHREAARKVLSELLPSDGDIKKAAVSRFALLEASGYKDSPQDFELLLRLLDSELRLLTPVSLIDKDTSSEDIASELSGSNSSSVTSERKVPAYRLTHDYLVPAIRTWIDRDLLEHRSGRLWLLLKQQASIWSERQSTRFLPTFVEYFQFRFFTSPKQWTQPQNAMMTAAFRRIAKNTLIVAGVTAALMFAVGAYQRSSKHAALKTEASSLLAKLRDAPSSDVSMILRRLRSLRQYIHADAQEIFADSDDLPLARFRAGLVDDKIDARQIPALVQLMIDSELPFVELRATIAYLIPHNKTLIPLVERHLQDSELSPKIRLRLAAWLCQMAPQSTTLSAMVEELVAELQELPMNDVTTAFEIFEPLAAPLSVAFLESYKQPQAFRQAEITIRGLLHYSDERDSLLARLLATANAAQFRAIVEIERQNPLGKRNWLETDLAYTEQRDLSDLHLANNAIANSLFGNARPLQEIARHRNSPLRTKTASLLASGRIGFSDLVSLCQTCIDNPPMLSMLLLASDGFASQQLPSHLRQQFYTILEHAYHNQSNAELHSVADVILKKWGYTPPEFTAQGDPHNDSIDPNKRRWFVDQHGNTLIILDIPATIHHASYQVALAAMEIPVVHIQEFQKDMQIEYGLLDSEVIPISRIPVESYTTFCNWLTAKEGIDSSEFCYSFSSKDLAESFPVDNFLERKGYRLPTLEEWNMALGGPDQHWLAGCDNETVNRYAWNRFSGQMSLQEVGTSLPNPQGFFDLLGNVSELVLVPNDKVQAGTGAYYGKIGGSSLTSAELMASSTTPDKYDVRIIDEFSGARVARTIAVRK